MDRFIESWIPLEDISQDKSERIADSAFFSEGAIRVWDSDLWDSELFLIDSWKHSDPSNKTNIEPCVAVFFAAGVVDYGQRVFSERTVDILHKSIFTQSNALNWIVWPWLVAFPQAPNMEQAPFVSSPIMCILLKYLSSTPLPSAIPLISS